MTFPVKASGVATLPDRIGAIKSALRAEYFASHQYPWLVAYSGGKDSTLLLQLIWEVLAEHLPSAQLRRVIVVANDTLVESPLVIRHLKDSLEIIAAAGAGQGLSIDVKITEPCIDQTFWVSVIGRGYIPPTRNFRWCTDRMKIRPTNRLIERVTRGTKGSILLIGTRRAESQNRQRTMEKRGISANRLNPHDSISHCWMFAPLADLDDDDVWMTLMQRRPPWGGSHRGLITLYRNAGGGECPLVLSKKQAASCGSSSPRFGCWTCTVVKKDRSLQGLVDAGYDGAERMEALLDFREWLVKLRENDDNRLQVRRDGNAKHRSDGSLVYGPFKLKVRKGILDRLQTLQQVTGDQLILPAEIECIKDIWWRDEICEDARSQLERSIVA